MGLGGEVILVKAEALPLESIALILSVVRQLMQLAITNAHVAVMFIQHTFCEKRRVDQVWGIRWYARRTVV